MMVFEKLERQLFLTLQLCLYKWSLLSVPLKARLFFGLPLAKVKPATSSTVHPARKSLRTRSRHVAYPGLRERGTQ